MKTYCTAKQVDIPDITDLERKVSLLSGSTANTLGTHTSRFVDMNTKQCPQTLLQGMFQTYLKREPTAQETAHAKSPIGLQKVAPQMMEEFMQTNYPDINLTSKVFAIVGASSGWGFTGAILLARYGARVHTCARTASVFEGGKSTAQATYEEYEAYIASSQTYFEAHGNLYGYVHNYYPMYSGLLNVSSATFDNIVFTECDTREPSSMNAFYQRIYDSENGNLDGVFQNPGLWGMANGFPHGSTFSVNASVNYTTGHYQTHAQIVQSAPNRGVGVAMESMETTERYGQMVSMDALISVYGMSKAKQTRFTLATSVLARSFGDMASAIYGFSLGDYISIKQASHIRNTIWARAGYNTAVIMPNGLGNSLNGMIASDFGVNTTYNILDSRLPTGTAGSYAHKESARVYELLMQNAWSVYGVTFLPEITLSVAIPIIASSSSGPGLGVRQIQQGNIAYTTSAYVTPPHQPFMSTAWKNKVGTCHLLDSSSSLETDGLVAAEHNMYGPGPEIVLQGQ